MATKGIYLITNKLDGKVYVGASQNIESRCTIWGILRRYRRFLLRKSRENQSPVEQACEDLQTIIGAVYQQNSVSSLQGLLGAGMQIYYRALPLTLNNDWQFVGRNNNLPFNRMLNFTYQLLEEFAKTAIYAAGLNPAQGYWHESYKTQEGLVKDLASEFKVLCDAVVIRVLNKG
jgi:CRISPR-associated protein Cas1